MKRTSGSQRHARRVPGQRHASRAARLRRARGSASWFVGAAQDERV